MPWAKVTRARITLRGHENAVGGFVHEDEVCMAAACLSVVAARIGRCPWLVFVVAVIGTLRPRRQ
jgi:hypothetical protein